MGWYGPNCQQLCACEHACPCDRETGSCNITYDLEVQDQLNKGTSECTGVDYYFFKYVPKLLFQLMFCLFSQQA